MEEEAELPSNETVASISRISKTRSPGLCPLLHLSAKVLLLILRLMWNKYIIGCWSMGSEEGCVDRVLVCHNCNQKFPFSANEQRFYRQKGLHVVPRRCYSCRKTSCKTL